MESDLGDVIEFVYASRVHRAMRVSTDDATEFRARFLFAFFTPVAAKKITSSGSTPGIVFVLRGRGGLQADTQIVSQGEWIVCLDMSASIWPEYRVWSGAYLRKNISDAEVRILDIYSRPAEISVVQGTTAGQVLRTEKDIARETWSEHRKSFARWFATAYPNRYDPNKEVPFEAHIGWRAYCAALGITEQCP